MSEPNLAWMQDMGSPRIIMGAKALLLWKLTMAFQWVHICHRAEIVIVSLWRKAGNIKMVINLDTQHTRIMDGTKLFAEYANPFEAHKDKKILDHYVEKYGTSDMLGNRKLGSK